MGQNLKADRLHNPSYVGAYIRGELLYDYDVYRQLYASPASNILLFAIYLKLIIGGSEDFS